MHGNIVKVIQCPTKVNISDMNSKTLKSVQIQEKLSGMVFDRGYLQPGYTSPGLVAHGK